MDRGVISKVDQDPAKQEAALVLSIHFDAVQICSSGAYYFKILTLVDFWTRATHHERWFRRIGYKSAFECARAQPARRGARSVFHLFCQSVRSRGSDASGTIRWQHAAY